MSHFLSNDHGYLLNACSKSGCVLSSSLVLTWSSTIPDLKTLLVMLLYPWEPGVQQETGSCSQTLSKDQLVASQLMLLDAKDEHLFMSKTF